MAISLKHNFVSPKSDGGDDTLVRPSDWNAEHALTQGTGTLLGRTTAGTGATEEITPGSGLSFTSQTLSVSLAGSNTYIQFNDSGVFGGTAGFTFDKATNNIVIGNTVTVGTNFIANGSGAYPLNNTSGIALGSSTQRWNLTGNTISVTGTITSSGNITGSNVNGAIGYFTGLVNAAHFTTTGNANAAIHYAGANVYSNTTSVRVGNSVVNTVISNNQIYLGNSTSNAIINSTSITMNGTGTESLSNSFVTSAGPDTVDSFVFAATRSAEYFYTVIHDGANAYQSGKVILLNDGGGGHLEEYGVAYSNTTQGLIGEFSSTTNATHVILQFTPASTISYTVKAVKNSLNA